MTQGSRALDPNYVRVLSRFRKSINYRCHPWLEENFVAERFVLDLEAMTDDFKASAGGSASHIASTESCEGVDGG